MRVRRVLLSLVVSAGVAALFCADVTTAQAPARGALPAQPPARGPAAAPARGAGSGRQVVGSLAQIMRAISFPNSNILFDVQDNDPGKKKPDLNGPYQGTYQGWEGVENAGIALAEVANLILLPGRTCSNGQPVPIQQADFVKFAQALRATGIAEYNAAKTKSVDAVNKLSDRLTETCANCHDKYRPDSRIGGAKVGPEKRCMVGV
jgi:cytochrome c5